MIREVPFNEEIPMAEFVFSREFMLMHHNYYCAVCREKPAVIDTNVGILQPCWTCQGKGYRVVKLNWIARIFTSIV